MRSYSYCCVCWFGHTSRKKTLKNFSRNVWCEAKKERNKTTKTRRLCEGYNIDTFLLLLPNSPSRLHLLTSTLLPPPTPILPPGYIHPHLPPPQLLPLYGNRKIGIYNLWCCLKYCESRTTAEKKVSEPDSTLLFARPLGAMARRATLPGRRPFAAAKIFGSFPKLFTTARGPLGIATAHFLGSVADGSTAAGGGALSRWGLFLGMIQL